MFNFFKKENVIYYLLLLKAKISYYYDEAIKYLFNVNNIIHYNAGEKKYITIRYFLIKIINIYINLLKQIRDLLDIEMDKVQLTKLGSNNKKIIFDSEMHYNEKITLKDTINYVKNINDNEIKLKKYIFMKIELHTPNNKPICLKNYIRNYEDNNNKTHNTLKNIVLFNNLNVDNINSKIKIVILKDGKRCSMEMEYEEIHNKHINDIFINLH